MSMFAPAAAVEILGSRAGLHSAPRGASSRIAKLRLDGTVHSLSSRRFVSHSFQELTAAQSDSPFVPFARRNHGGTDRDETRVLPGNIPIRQPRMQESSSLRAPVIEAPAGLSLVETAPSSQAQVPSVSLDDVRLRTLMTAVQRGDTRTVYLQLTKLLSPSTTDNVLRDAVASLPQTTFSELLRCLDPARVSQALDWTRDVSIGPGMATSTPLGEDVDEFGVRKLWRVLLRGLVTIYQLRKQTGSHTLVSDYSILIRCAGAASDPLTAKKIWHEMDSSGLQEWRQSALYNEFIQARFLTEPMHYQYDLARFRVRPLNLQNQKLKGAERIPSKQLLRLERLRLSIERMQQHRFGQDVNSPLHNVHLTRLMRKTKPITRVFSKAELLSHAADEKLICSAMVAFARTGSLRMITRLLWDKWKINVRTVDKTTKEIEVRGGMDYPEDSLMRPTARLLDAVVHSFCCNGEITSAFKLLDFISRRYEIQIPDKIWFDLLEWTYVMQTRPASLEWKIAGFPNKGLHRNAVELIWQTMTSEPYHVKPGFQQYNILIKTYIAQGRLREAMREMLALRPVYDDALRRYEEVAFATVQALRQGGNGGNGGSPGSATVAYKAAQAHKWLVWYCFSEWTRGFLKKVRSARVGDPFAEREVPKFVETFAAFLPTGAGYRTATGHVAIRNTEAAVRVRHDIRASIFSPALRVSRFLASTMYGTQIRRGPGTGGVAALSDGRRRLRRTRRATHTRLSALRGLGPEIEDHLLEREFT